MKKSVTLVKTRMGLAQAALLSALVVGALGSAHAATDTASFNVKIKITETCSFTTTGTKDVDFGTEARTSAAVSLSATGELVVNCSSGTSYIIGLDGGSNYLLAAGSKADPAPNNRRMKSAAGDFIAYDLYQTAGGTFWGNKGTLAAKGNTLSGTGDGADQKIEVHGKVTSINVPAGSYSDSVTATITY